MKLAVLAGDGVGPEVTEAAVRVLKSTTEFYDIELELAEAPVGGVAIRECSEPLPSQTRDVCLAADAVLLGAVGDPSFDHLPPGSRPEFGLLQLRKELGGFANLRPARAIPALIGASPLRPEVFQGTDLLIVRELLGGLYFGEPRRLGDDDAVNTLEYSKSEIERVARVAFELASSRGRKLTSVDKANVLETSMLWRKTVENVAKDYPDVTLEHLYVDACAMHLVTSPSRFDVLLTDNLFGDILSDEAAVLTGSLGVLASATVGGPIDLYEPIHGSAPDLAGRNTANPIGSIASVAMLLRHTLDHETAACAIEGGIEAALEEGSRTKDIAGEGNAVSTTEMTDRIIEKTIEHAGMSHAFHAV